jgi:glycogen operon protein
MIAEPWDVTRYSLGDFPHPWREWNDAYRDSVRQFWLGDLARGYGEGIAYQWLERHFLLPRTNIVN